MDFLNRLYESNYFGIGLFAIIAFLVVAFLIVLFFGKKDEKKRKLEETNSLDLNNNFNDHNAFKETTAPVPLEVNNNLKPVSVPTPIVEESPLVNSITEPLENLNMAPSIEELEPVKPIVFNNPIPEPVTPIIPTLTPISEPTPVNKTFNNENQINQIPIFEKVETTPIIEPLNPSYEHQIGINVPSEQIIKEEPTPVNIEPTTFINPESIPPVTPVTVDPIKITIPNEPVAPVITEEKPLINPIFTEQPQIMDEPIIGETYYKPIEKTEPSEIKVPSIDFDALAKSISKELDDLEKTKIQKETPTSTQPVNTFSSVYVNNRVTETIPNSASSIDLPKKIDLPTKKIN